MDLVLADSDKVSPTWLKLKTAYTERLRVLRSQLPNLVLNGALNHAQAHAGRISEVLELLALGDTEHPGHASTTAADE